MEFVRNRIKQLIRPFVAKPWKSPTMEVRYGLWIGVSALFSESGRQLGEENTRPFILNHHVPAETMACKYEGSRNGRMINMSALRIAMKNYDEALTITGVVRQFHMEKAGKLSPDAVPGIWDLYIIARASIAIIAYQMRYRGGLGGETAIADALTSQYQFISGVFMICREMMNNGEPAIAENHPISAEDLYAYADDKNIFVSFNGMACAGSTRKIMDFLEFCNSGPAEAGASSTGKTSTESSLQSLVSDVENWYKYALSTIELDCFIESEAACRQGVMHSGRAAHFDKVQEIYQSLSRYCGEIVSSVAVVEDIGNFYQGALNRQNAILSLLDRPAINTISKKHIAERLGQ